MPTNVPRSFKAGDRVGRWLLVEPTHAGRASFVCRCDCGSEKIIPAHNLASGRSQSCGCLRRAWTAARFTRHGDSKSVEYKTWAGMLKRCNNPRTKSFADYGGRGIVVCDRWRTYEAFLADNGRRPTPQHSLDRIDVNGNYEPSNCRWATKVQQAKNKRCSKRVASSVTINDVLAAHGLMVGG